MPILDDLKKTLEEFPAKTGNAKELVQLQEFLNRMKKEGVVQSPEYDIPQPDTIGRTLLETKCANSAQFNAK